MLEKKIAIVTGGGSGIGAATAQRLAQDGAAVLVVDRDVSAMGRIVDAICAAGGRALGCHADISIEADMARVFDEAEDAFGGVDLAFLNAGILQPYVPLTAITTELFDRVMAVNLRGTFFGIRLAVARLRDGGACLVNASAAGLIGLDLAAAYSASKHGVVGLVRSSAAAFAARGLRINAICPGGVLTPINGVEQIDDLIDPFALTDAPYRGMMSAQHVAELAVFLLGPRAAGMNGHAHPIDAGLLSALPPNIV